MGVYIPIQYGDKAQNNFGKDDLKEVLALARPILEDHKVKKTGQNIKFDALVMKKHGINVAGITFDTMLAAHLIKPEGRSYKMDNLSLEYLNYRMVPIEDLIGKGKNQISMSDVDLEKASFYAAEDADVALQLTEIFQKRLDDENLTEFYEKVELPLVPVLVNMEYGLLVNQFKVSYRWVKFNMFGNTTNNSINPDSYSILPIRHLEVVWQFWD